MSPRLTRFFSASLTEAEPAVTLGIRLGTPAATTRGFGAAESCEVGLMINEVFEDLSRSNARLSLTYSAAFAIAPAPACWR